MPVLSSNGGAIVLKFQRLGWRNQETALENNQPAIQGECGRTLPDKDMQKLGDDSRYSEKKPISGSVYTSPYQPYFPCPSSQMLSSLSTQVKRMGQPQEFAADSSSMDEHQQEG
mmetsp:Transcript_55165/g.96202  ORF Transcript_55165/g.96202 Transcript_55165/m.96202 type:complete len:114 (-) Transcript_55165:661-1002(-)